MRCSLNAILKNDMLAMMKSPYQRYLVVITMESFQLFNGGLLSACTTTWPRHGLVQGREYVFSMRGLELLLAFQEFHFLAKACNVWYYSPMATPYSATPSKIIQYISWIFGSSMLQEFCS